jgi:hypothetical protein
MKQGDIGRAKKFVASNRIDLTNQYFGRLKVLCYYDTTDDKDRKAKWLCECVCGNFKVVRGRSLRNGDTKSCGCRGIKHSMTGTRLYKIWKSMKGRCLWKKGKARIYKNFKNYVQRKITICPEWAANFIIFKNWAISHGYADNLSIDRIDNTKGYSPENCRWATPEQQSNNTSTNHFITFNEKTQTISQWSREINISASTISFRLKNNWSKEEALTIPPNLSNRRKRKDLRRATE